MKKDLHCLLVVLFFLIKPDVYSQINCEVPQAPVLNSVTVEPEVSSSILNWTLSPSPDVVAYIIYSYETRMGNPGFYAVDTVWNPSATSYTYDKGKIYRSFQFRVAAFRRPVCTSELSNILSTIFVSAVIDTCSRKINLTWNKYISYPKNVIDYSVQVSTNGSSFIEITRVPSETDNYTLDNFLINTSYCFEIRANLEGGAISLSNKACVTTTMLRPPSWINADYATVVDESDIKLSFSIDPESETDLYSLEKRTGPSGAFLHIAQIRSTLKTIEYTDKGVDPETNNFYRLSAVNNCNIPIITSNPASNIVATVQNTGNQIILKWNKYQKWMGLVSSYRIYTDTGNGFNETASVSQADTIYSINIPDIMYTLTKDEVCFYISSVETGNPYGITGESNSNKVCTDIREIITIPNVFSPDGDLINDLFRPVLTFTPSEYRLVISDRNGRTLFDSDDFMESWDGSVNGKVVAEGVYMWFLRVTTPEGNKISRTGTITVIKN